MTFEIGKCWDCPLPLFTVLLQVVGGLAAVTLGMFLIRKGQPSARFAGRLMLILAAFWYFFVAVGIVRFGVSWNGKVFMTTDQMAEWRLMRVADITLVLTWLLATFATIRRLRPQPSVV